jgi:hypothetical protein
MRRVPLVQVTMEAWGRLDAAQRHRFFEAFVAAAVRLDKLELRAWLRRRLREPPLVAIDPASFTISDADIAHLLRTAGNAPGGEAAAGPDRDEADGG